MNLKRFSYNTKRLYLLVFLQFFYLQVLQANNIIDEKSNVKTSIYLEEIVQDLTIKGTVVDETGMPLPGVNIVEKGTTNGASTDIDGKYQISVSNDAILIISYIGYTTQEIAVNGQLLIDVKMEANAASLNEIIIKGFRGSQQRAIKIKREATSVVEAITPADMGNYSDENIADAIQRVPGLQVERNDSGNGGGDRVSIRGVGPQFVNVTINGRTPLSSGTEGIEGLRQFNLDVLPPEIIQGALVYKTSEASLVEPGLGGLVDFQTLKPLSATYKDESNYFGSINVRGELDEQTPDSGIQPRINVLFGGKTKDNKLGIYTSLLSSNSLRAFDAVFGRARDFNMKEDTNNDGVFDVNNGDTLYENVLTPGGVSYNPVREDRERFATSSGIQWKPTENLEIMADVTYSKYDNKSFRDVMTVTPGMFNNVFAPGNLNIVDGVLKSVNTIGSFNANSGAPTESNRIRHQYVQYDNLTENTIGGLNAIWKKDDWTISADYSFSKIHFEQRLEVGGQRNIVIPMQLDISGEAPVLTINEDDFYNLDNVTMVNGSLMWDRLLEGDNNAFKLDFKKEINDEFDFRFGGRINSTTLERRQASAGGGGHPAEYLDKQAFQDNYLSPADRDFLPGMNIGFNSWPTFNYAAIQAASPDVLGRRAGTSFEGDLFGNVVDGDLPLDRANSWRIKEKTFSLYSQLDFKTEIGNTSVSGNLGLRAINTDVLARAFSTANITDPDSVLDPINVSFEPTTVESDRWDFTPSLNLNFGFSDKFNYRFSIVNTISRPEYTDLAPTHDVTAINPLSTAYGTANGSVTVSNPELKPYSTWQFDNTFEFYNKTYTIRF